MSDENVTAGKLRAFLHQIENRIFSRAADGGQISQVNDQFASASLLACISPGCAKLINPRPDERSFDDQRALRGRVDDGNLEHVAHVITATRLPKPRSVPTGQSVESIGHGEPDWQV
jgi:hypothetical protein